MALIFSLKLVFLRNKYSAFKVVFSILSKAITNRITKEKIIEKEAKKHFLQTHPVRPNFLFVANTLIY